MMQIKIFKPIFFLLLLTAFSCNRVKEKTKQTLNKGGETVGKTATEFLEGVSEGVDKTMQCEIVLSAGLSEKGIKTGTFNIQSDSSGLNKNKLVIYLIFEKDFNGNLKVKSFDKSGLESGRTALHIEQKAGSASYFDFVFDNRTNIESKSRLVFEEFFKL